MFHHISWAMKADTPDALSRWLLVILADHANDTHICWPSIATLARRTGMHTATVCRKLKLLEEAHLIKRLRGSEGRSTRYQLVIAECDNLIAERDTKLPVNNLNKKKEVPFDWKPSDKLCASIDEVSFSAQQETVSHDIETVKFVNHHISNGSKFANFEAAYRKWCANAITFSSASSSRKNAGRKYQPASADDHDRRWSEFIGSVRR
jgi:DNA-binding MarR family transcriptional regulator